MKPLVGLATPAVLGPMMHLPFWQSLPQSELRSSFLSLQIHRTTTTADPFVRTGLIMSGTAFD
jgi:hypothetical protein